MRKVLFLLPSIIFLISIYNVSSDTVYNADPLLSADDVFPGISYDGGYVFTISVNPNLYVSRGPPKNFKGITGDKIGHTPIVVYQRDYIVNDLQDGNYSFIFFYQQILSKWVILVQKSL